MPPVAHSTGHPFASESYSASATLMQLSWYNTMHTSAEVREEQGVGPVGGA